MYQNYETEAENRNELKTYLAEKGVGTLTQWGGKAIHQFKGLDLGDLHLPRTERLFQRVLMLPMHQNLSDEQVVYVCECIRAFYVN